ncbi:protein-L-isoaspartate(D-aspartate) O-methyltransferase [Reticulomyxa filosa]|uniref:protein-L-isoaspartate(D-aspartate) O-methyltransferase n=1 Tax=Reticulomyxa filosa TaxID=46433 RepID=X6M056_RETFI|nr:protein-L-isoaspartate(D-aspartate) O-methyltransferase [Reticulomyxa filosa]|eukprot:ETO06971.1 protein-L-isoaspartate(D-aspartate) O-methyltransferase [Reticulomyxa filosa]
MFFIQWICLHCIRKKDVGSGSGYWSVVVAEYIVHSLPNKKPRVIGIEIEPGLVRQSIANTNKGHKRLLEQKYVEFVAGEVLQVLSDNKNKYVEKMFDCIHVGAASSVNQKNVLRNYLKIGGMMIIPLDDPATSSTVMTMVTRQSQNGFNESPDIFVRYVPLRSNIKI